MTTYAHIHENAVEIFLGVVAYSIIDLPSDYQHKLNEIAKKYKGRQERGSCHYLYGGCSLIYKFPTRKKLFTFLKKARNFKNVVISRRVYYDFISGVNLARDMQERIKQ